MRRNYINFISVLSVGFLLGCSAVKLPLPPAPQDTAASEAATPKLSGTGTPTAASVLDVASQSERAAAATPAARSSDQLLGVTIAALGNPAETGFWLKTSLVGEKTQGQIVNPATGAQVTLTLIPLEAASGSQLSLSAMRMLGVALTSLVEIKVYNLTP